MRRFRLTHRGIGFVVAGVACFLAAAAMSVPALLYATGLLLGTVIVAVLFVGLGPGRVTVERAFSPQVVDPGHGVRARMTVTNQSGFLCPEATWADQLPRVVAGRASGVLPSLGPAGGPDSRIAATYALTSSTRGHHEVGPLRLEVSDPFGLVRRQRLFGGRHRLTVLPHRFVLSPLRSVGLGDSGSTRPAPQHVGVGEEDVIARPYLPGDAMKRLHWKATAHRGELMVRQEEHHVSPRATVLLDLDALTHGTARHRGEWEHSATLEWSVSAAASAVTHLAAMGYVVNLVSHDHTVDVIVGDGADTLRDALIALAGCEASEGSAQPIPAERYVVMATGRLLDDRAADWIAAMPPDTRVHALVAVATHDRVLDRLAAAGWRVATYGPRSDIPDVWAGLDENAHAAR